jgi:hypothetical protein
MLLTLIDEILFFLSLDSYYFKINTGPYYSSYLFKVIS